MFSDSEYFLTRCTSNVSTSLSSQPFLYDPRTEIYITYDDPKSFGVLFHVIQCGTYFPWQLPRASISPKLVSTGLRCLKLGVIIIACSSMLLMRPCYDAITQRVIHWFWFPLDLYSMARLVMMYGTCVLIPVSHCLFIFTATYQAPCSVQPEFINVHMLTVNEISMSATFVLLMKPD